MDPKCLVRDIGVDQDGFMEVLIERGTPLPHEFSCRIQLNELSELTIYEGNYVDTVNNETIGTYSVEQKGVFVFQLHVSDDYKMKLYIEDRLIGIVDCNQQEQEVPMEETRRWWNARKDFMDYIESTTLFLEDPMTQRIPERTLLMEKLSWASQIIDYDVSTEEYQLALREIEDYVNPILQTLNQTIERSSLE